MKKPIAEKDFRAWNEEMARKYDPDLFHRESSRVVQWIERLRVRYILKYADCKGSNGVLEVGCGAGNIMKKIPAPKRYGIDLSWYLIRKAQVTLRGEAVLLISRAEALPFRDSEFDVVICSEVLEHVVNPAQILSEIARVVKDDGKVIISIPCTKMVNLIKRTLGALGLYKFVMHTRQQGYQMPPRMNEEWHLHAFGLTMLKRVIKDHLDIKKVKGIPLGILPVRYVVEAKRRSMGEAT